MTVAELVTQVRELLRREPPDRAEVLRLVEAAAPLSDAATRSVNREVLMSPIPYCAKQLLMRRIGGLASAQRRLLSDLPLGGLEQ